MVATLKAPKGCEKRGKYYHCRLQSPSKCASGSYRTIPTGGKRGTKLVVCCPKGKFNSRTKRCKVGTFAQKKLIPVR